MSKRKQIAMLEKIGEFLSAAPGSKKEKINWEKLSERKMSAQNCLNVLAGMYGEAGVGFACTDIRPRESVDVVADGCTSTSPRVKLDAGTFGCPEGRVKVHGIPSN